MNPISGNASHLTTLLGFVITFWGRQNIYKYSRHVRIIFSISYGVTTTILAFQSSVVMRNAAAGLPVDGGSQEQNAFTPLRPLTDNLSQSLGVRADRPNCPVRWETHRNDIPGIDMVQGLGFLSKKSWHTKNLANQEKVWIAEQRKVEEERRTKELAKQIQLEREQEELAKIAGKSASQYDRGIDWMYNHGQECAKEDALKEQEEYLLGKAVGSEMGVMKGDLAAVAEADGGVNRVLAEQQKHMGDDRSDEKPPAAWTEPSVAEKNEAFRLRMEDPMFAVMQKSREMEKAIESKAKLYEKVTGKKAVFVSTQDVEKDHKRRKEEKKHKSKRHKHSRSRRVYSSDSSSESYQKHKKRRRARSRSRSRSRSPRRDDRRGSGYCKRSPLGSHHDRRRRSPSPYDNHRTDGGRRDYSRNIEESIDHYRHSRDRHERKPPPREYERYEKNEFSDRGRSERDDRPRDNRYGLQGGKVRTISDLGPDRELLNRKRLENMEKRLRQESELRQQRSHEDRAKALSEMQRDAMKRREIAKDLPTSGIYEDRPANGHASFLSDLTREAHGLDGTGISLNERLRQNRSSNQKTHESFL